MAIKNFFSLFLLNIYFCSVFAYEHNRPLLVVVLMVKNEEAVIKETLEMYCKADPTGEKISYLIFDTGSTDLTTAKAKELFDEYPLSNYYIEQELFIDFSTSRNRALRITEEKFPHAAFMLMPDAEWYLNDVLGLLEFCELYFHQTNFKTFFVRILSANLDFYTVRLMRAHQNAEFSGVVHECLKNEPTTSAMLPASIYFEYPETPIGLEASKKRWVRDCDLLLKEHNQNPKNCNLHIHLQSNRAALVVSLWILAVNKHFSFLYQRL